MQYPLNLRFKLFALAPQVTITDGTGKLLMYVKQKLFKLKEHVMVYADTNQQNLIFEIKADRMIDFSANYSFTSPDGTGWGAVRRKGAKSIWRAHYEVIEEGRVDMVIQEENPWKRVLEAVLEEIPVVGLIAIIMINPSYLIKRPNGEPVMRITKKRSLLESGFEITKLAEIPEDDEIRMLLSLIMIAFLERRRG